MKISKQAESVSRAVVDGHARQVAEIELDADEQVTFCTPNGAEYDVAMKEWGLYATPSVGSRLPKFRLHAVLVRGESGLYLMLVEKGKEELFAAEMNESGLKIQAWIDRGVETLDLR